MATLVDTNILLDLLEVGSPWESWSSGRLHDARSDGAVVINAIIYAEMAGFDSASMLEAAIGPSRFSREHIPYEAGWLAGRAFLQYRRQGGDKRSPMPDFYIGAHALVAGHRLLTRDPARYRNYFPTLDIIAPDTHP